MNKYFLAASLFGLFLIVLSFALVHHAQAVAEAQHSQYLSDLRTADFAEIAITAYADQHNKTLPDAHHWEESIAPYWSEPPDTVSLKAHPGDRLAMNSELSGMKLSQVALPDSTILLYETHSDTKDTSGLPPWKQYRQCGMSAKGWRLLGFVSGWSSSYAAGPEMGFTKK